MFCSRCGSSVPDDAVFCCKCGSRLPLRENGRLEDLRTLNENPVPDEPEREDPVSETTSPGGNPLDKEGGIFDRVYSILFSPTSEWAKIVHEKPRPLYLVFAFLLLLSLGAGLCLFVGDILRFYIYVKSEDMQFMGCVYRVMTITLIKVVELMAIPVIAALVINSLTPAFKAERNYGRILQLTTYAFVPVLVSRVFYIFPFGFISYMIQFLSLYGIVLLLVGFRKILPEPENKDVGFFFASAGILFGVYFVLHWIIRFVQLSVYDVDYMQLTYFL